MCCHRLSRLPAGAGRRAPTARQSRDPLSSRRLLHFVPHRISRHRPHQGGRDVEREMPRRQIVRRARVPTWERAGRLSRASCGNDGMVDSTGCELDRRDDVFAFKVGHFIEYLLEGKPAREQIQDVRHPYSHPSNARPSATLIRMESDSFTSFGHCAIPFFSMQDETWGRQAGRTRAWRLRPAESLMAPSAVRSSGPTVPVSSRSGSSLTRAPPPRMSRRASELLLTSPASRMRS